MNEFDFQSQLVMSTGVAAREDITQILLEHIPGAIAMIKANTRDDKSGTDYWIEHKRGTPISVDTKIRNEDPVETRGKDDLALETWSVVNEKIGWTLDEKKRTDFILWWFPTRRWVLVPFPQLQAVFRQFQSMWTRKYFTCRQRTIANGNRGWQSECVFVPREVVLDAIKLRYGGAPVPHRRPTSNLLVNSTSPIAAIVTQMTGARAPMKDGKLPSCAENQRHAQQAAGIVHAHGWPTLEAVIRADRERRPGCRRLNGLIHAGYPLADLEAFLVDLGRP